MPIRDWKGPREIMSPSVCDVECISLIGNL